MRDVLIINTVQVLCVYIQGEREKARGVGAPFKRKRKNSNSLTALKKQKNRRMIERGG
jgi:hypothetical protein